MACKSQILVFSLASFVLKSDLFVTRRFSSGKHAVPNGVLTWSKQDELKRSMSAATQVIHSFIIFMIVSDATLFTARSTTCNMAKIICKPYERPSCLIKSVKIQLSTCHASIRS
ncbi:hypothetical protein MTO96_021887 [Rhipicephalus appendiculatus]